MERWFEGQGALAAGAGGPIPATWLADGGFAPSAERGAGAR